MSVLVDTVVWSLAFRRKRSSLSTEELALRQRLDQLFAEGQAALIGPVRQELLSGIRDRTIFEALRHDLRSVPDAALELDDFEKAAEISNACRRDGIASTPTDALICAAGLRRQWPIFTKDRDFQRYARILPITLWT